MKRTAIQRITITFSLHFQQDWIVDRIKLQCLQPGQQANGFPLIQAHQFGQIYVIYAYFYVLSYTVVLETAARGARLGRQKSGARAIPLESTRGQCEISQRLLAQPLSLRSSSTTGLVQETRVRQLQRRVTEVKFSTIQSVIQQRLWGTLQLNILLDSYNRFVILFSTDLEFLKVCGSISAKIVTRLVDWSVT